MTFARRSAPAVAALAAAGLWLSPGAASAEPRRWVVDEAASQIAFVYEANGEPAEGAFRRVSGEGLFDPEDPGATRLELRIDVSSLDLGDPLASAFALSADWFDAANHPEARYRLARLAPLDDGRYAALGDIAIRDRLQVVETGLEIEIGADVARARGEVEFDRLDFGIGRGFTALFVSIGRAVSVRIDLVARPAD